LERGDRVLGRPIDTTHPEKGSYKRDLIMTTGTKSIGLQKEPSYFFPSWGEWVTSSGTNHLLCSDGSDGGQSVFYVII
jgi:hypothetical protein